MRFLTLLSDYRWPIGIGALLTMPIVASAVIVWVATRPDSPRPIEGYYEAAQQWDADEAVELASRQLGWTVRYELPAGIPHYVGMPRPVDVHVADRDGRPVTGLAGRFVAIRPADTRLNQSGAITEIPQQPGRYRTLVLIDQPGAWDFRLDAAQGALRFVHGARFDVSAEAAASEGTPR